jgi:thiol-disulfide isomerase/thioredoxin
MYTLNPCPLAIKLMASRLLLCLCIAMGAAWAPGSAQPLSQNSPAPISLKIGKVAALPDIQLLDGRVWRQSDAVGKVVIIELWHTRCPFCAKQNPLLNAFYLQNRHRGLEVIAVSTDKSRDDVVAYVKKNGYAFDVAMANPDWLSTYGARKGLPQLFVLDRRSVLRAIELREMFPDDIEELTRFL